VRKNIVEILVRVKASASANKL